MHKPSWIRPCEQRKCFPRLAKDQAAGTLLWHSSRFDASFNRCDLAWRHGRTSQAWRQNMLHRYVDCSTRYRSVGQARRKSSIHSRSGQTPQKRRKDFWWHFRPSINWCQRLELQNGVHRLSGLIGRFKIRLQKGYFKWWRRKRRHSWKLDARWTVISYQYERPRWFVYETSKVCGSICLWPSWC